MIATLARWLRQLFVDNETRRNRAQWISLALDNALSEVGGVERPLVGRKVTYVAIPDKLPALPPADDACICKGNWRALVKKTEYLIGRKYRYVGGLPQCKGKIYTFFGLVHGNDDYYYGMCANGDLQLLSCVGSLEGFGWELMP